MKFSAQQDQVIRNTQINRINQRWGQLYGLDKEWSDNAIKYLFLTNSGGAIAVLSYMGAVGTSFRIGMAVALCSFLLGLILVGVMTASIYQRIDALFKNWRADTDRYFSDQIEWDDLIKNDKKRVGNSILETVLGYLSFLCFIAGTVVGLVSFFTK